MAIGWTLLSVSRLSSSRVFLCWVGNGCELNINFSEVVFSLAKINDVQKKFAGPSRVLKATGQSALGSGCFARLFICIFKAQP